MQKAAIHIFHSGCILVNITSQSFVRFEKKWSSGSTHPEVECATSGGGHHLLSKAHAASFEGSLVGGSTTTKVGGFWQPKAQSKRALRHNPGICTWHLLLLLYYNSMGEGSELSILSPYLIKYPLD